MKTRIACALTVLMIAALFTQSVPRSLVAAQEKVAQDKSEESLINKYQNIEVANFDVKDGVKFPPDYMKPMMDDIVAKLVETKKFRKVWPPGDAASDATAPTLQLVGTVVDFKPGSRTKRYVIGLGAGKTRVITHVRFIDKASGKVLYERDATGGVSWGIFGGDSKEAVEGVGKQVADAVKKKFF